MRRKFNMPGYGSITIKYCGDVKCVSILILLENYKV